MNIQFGFGANMDAMKYTVTDFNVTLGASEEFSRSLGNFVPGTISVSLEIAQSQKEKPAVDLFEFAMKQHDDAKTDGKGKINVYKGKELGQPTQVIEFEKAWFTDISTGASRHDETFSLHLTIECAKLTVSGINFEDFRKGTLVDGT
jgi:hypothetical protein